MACSFDNRAFAVTLPLQLDEDQSEWAAGPYDDNVDHEEEAAYGVEAACRLIAALHAKATVPTALQLVPQVHPNYDKTDEGIKLMEQNSGEISLPKRTTSLAFTFNIRPLYHIATKIRVVKKKH